MKISRAMFIAAFSLLAVSVASASDIPTKATSQMVATAPNWTGLYGGGFVGGQQGKSNTTTDSFTDSQSYVIPGQTNPVQTCYTRYVEDQPVTKCWDSKYKSVTTQPYTLNTSQTYPSGASNGNVIGITFGGILGVNQQLSTDWVAGVEVDGGYSGAKGQTNILLTNAESKMPWNVNVTARLIALPTKSKDLGVYVKGGLAVQNQQTYLTGPTGSASEDKTKAGWTVGGGIEKKIPAWKAAARVEAMYSKVSDQTVSIPGASTTLNGASWNMKAGLVWSLN